MAPTFFKQVFFRQSYCLIAGNQLANFLKTQSTFLHFKSTYFNALSKHVVHSTSKEARKRLAPKDVADRNLRDISATRAAATLANKKECIFRHVFFILLKKSLYLFYFCKKHHFILERSSYTKLVEDAKNMITELTLTTEVMEWLDIDEDMLESMGWGDSTQLTWVECALLLAPDATSAYVESVMDECMAIFDTVSIRMSTHLQLTADNIFRSCLDTKV